jgi:hypothetical protein
MITPIGPTPSSNRSHIDWKTLIFFKIQQNSISIMKDQILFLSVGILPPRLLRDTPEVVSL